MHALASNGIAVESESRLYPEASLISYSLSWYAVYTSANREKRVAEHCAGRSVEHFLPLYDTARRWKDRSVRLQLPLFPGYVFVRIVPGDLLRVLKIPGVARIVGFGGKPAALPNDEIEALRTSVGNGTRAEPHPLLTAGRKVRVKNGPMSGLRGILKRRANRTRLIVSVLLIQRAVALEVDEADIEPDGGVEC
jgi:transcription antitermination factor NusG